MPASWPGRPLWCAQRRPGIPATVVTWAWTATRCRTCITKACCPRLTCQVCCRAICKRVARDVIKAAASEGRVQNRNALRHLAMVGTSVLRVGSMCCLQACTACHAICCGQQRRMQPRSAAQTSFLRCTTRHSPLIAQGEDALEQYVEACSYVPNYDSLVFLP